VVCWQFSLVGNDIGQISEVALRLARLVLGWVTLSGFTSWCGKSPRSTQPVHPSVGRRNEYQSKGSDTLRLGSRGRYGSCLVSGKTV